MTLPEFHTLSGRYPLSPTHATSPPPHGSASNVNDTIVAPSPRSYINSAGSEKPLTPFVDLPPAHTPPVRMHDIPTFEETVQATRNSVSAGRQAARHRLNDIQRLTAAISIPAANQDKNRSSSDALVMQGDKATRSAVALEVAARRPSGKKVLFVQRQLTGVNNGSPTSTLRKKAASFNDEDDSLEGGSSILTLDNSPSNATTPRESTERKKTSGSGSSTSGTTKNPVIVIRAAAAIDATERERSRAGAIGRLLVGKGESQQGRKESSGNQKEDQISPPSPSSATMIPVRPSAPRPSASTTTTIKATSTSKATTTAPATATANPLEMGSGGGAFVMKNPKKQKLKAESVIDKLRQTSIA